MPTTSFRQRIRSALADPALQIALDANASRRVEGRLRAFESLPDWQDRRHRAHAVRLEVIADLDVHLQRFAARASENGFIVHRAADAADANLIILEIVKNSRADTGPSSRPPSPLLVAKSKSMVSEEIGLNHVLESHGIRVVETDLGEYIVQLRGERPSHIITPAVHLRRHEVGQLFHEKLGIPYTEDVPALTAAARQVLRQVFLTADVGVSGVNFGVADTGALCIVSNEGNARMVATLPPVHIALMGMERLVPNSEDLALMLSLLPRSATGQKLSVYTQLIQRPLPGQVRHLIILDNGRSALRSSPLAEALLCIRCGACLNACPVFREIGGHGYNSVYPGPIGSVISASFFGPDLVPLAQASSLCGACKDACPVDIDLPKLLTRVRAQLSPTRPTESRRARPATAPLSRSTAIFLRLYGRLARTRALFSAAQRIAGLGLHLASPFADWVRLPAFTGWGFSKDLPRFAGQSFRSTVGPSGGSWPAEDVRPAPIQHQPDRREPASSPPHLPTSLADQFAHELLAVSGNLVRTSDDGLSQSILDIVRVRGLRRISIEPVLLERIDLSASDLSISTESDPSIQLGVTSAVCGLADTGSIVVTEHLPHRRPGSLVPEIHVAILRESDLLPTLSDALNLPEAQESAAAVVITGPSRTGDIEMTHTIGVHGPRELHVLLVQ